MNPLHLDAAQVVQRGARDLEYANYLELYRRALPSSALDDLAQQCQTFLSSTEKLYEDWADKLFRTRVGVSLGEAERWDVPRLFRAPEWDPIFPADRMVPALESTLEDLGIDLNAQENVVLACDYAGIDRESCAGRCRRQLQPRSWQLTRGGGGDRPGRRPVRRGRVQRPDRSVHPE